MKVRCITLQVEVPWNAKVASVFGGNYCIDGAMLLQILDANVNRLAAAQSPGPWRQIPVQGQVFKEELEP